MSLRSRVLDVLNGPAVARMRFRFPIRGSHVTIAPQTFHHVARAIRLGQVTVAVPTDLAAGVAAQYNDVARTRADGTAVAANTLEVVSATGRLDAAYIVHESLHAAYDLLRTGLDANAEEASAYVCTALYCRMTGLPSPSLGQRADLRQCRRSRPNTAVPVSEGRSRDSLGRGA
ncbi:hypothetical protein [Bradyrhizobium sp. LM2.9]